MRIAQDFFKADDVVRIARELLGKVICTDFNGHLTSGVITETEAYAGSIDRASHAYNHRRTDRTEVMFHQGGIAYIYLCYGIHHLFNFVTGPEGVPHAVLLRGIYPLDGIPVMEERRRMKLKGKGFTDGPGKVTRALGLYVDHNGSKIGGDIVWLEDRGIKVRNECVTVGPRIGVDYAGEDALLPYRFRYGYEKA